MPIHLHRRHTAVLGVLVVLIVAAVSAGRLSERGGSPRPRRSFSAQRASVSDRVVPVRLGRGVGRIDLGESRRRLARAGIRGRMEPTNTLAVRAAGGQILVGFDGSGHVIQIGTDGLGLSLAGRRLMLTAGRVPAVVRDRGWRTIGCGGVFVSSVYRFGATTTVTFDNAQTWVQLNVGRLTPACGAP